MLAAIPCYAQSPTGIITGTVTDPSGGVVPNATLTVTNRATSVGRTVSSNSDGVYSAPSLEPGQYEVRAESSGFSTTVRPAEAQAGVTTTVNIPLSVGATNDVVNVEAASAQINYESNTIQGTIARQTIQDIPLNGRSYLQLASLEPGVTMQAGATSQYNGVFTVSILGGIAGRTLITLDGANIDDSVQGGSSMNFSQEVVQEFQLQALNSDLSTGITGSGAINVVTRSGSNDFHGGAYFFYRDHNMAAYTGLSRQPLFPNPFFARRNPGFTLGGPIKKEKLFFFFNYEYQNQVQAVTVQEDLPIFKGLNGAFSSPYHLKTISGRLDYHLSDRNNLFLRYSHDGNDTFGPPSGTPLPSAWLSNVNYADQGIFGITTIIRPTLVNDARASFEYWSNKNGFPTASQCPAPCVGFGLPSILATVGSSTFGAGNYANAPQFRTVRRWEINDNLQWQKGQHRFRVGADLERFSAPIDWEFCTPFCTVLIASLSPGAVNTTADLLNVPVFNIGAGIFSGIGIGSGHYPGPYDHDQQNHNLRPRMYFQDTWKIRPNLTANYGLAWEYETGLFNSDLTPPSFLAPIYGANNLHPTKPQKDEFQPVFGFAYSPGKSGKTVIRGGAGMYWETNYYFEKWRGSALYGPVGDARITLEADALKNTFPGIVNFSTLQPVPIGAPLPINQASNLTFGQMISLYNSQIGVLTQKFSPSSVPASGAFSVSGLDVAKTAIELFPPNYVLGRSYQTSIGVQRDLGHDLTISADWARRQGSHFNLSADLDVNHTNVYANGALVGGIIPSCAPQNYTPGVECVNGPINQWIPEGRSIYEGLLVKVTKRMSRNYQFIASYAYQNLNTDYNTVNLFNYVQSYGPSLARQNLNVAAIVNLPWGFNLTMNSQILSRTPVSIVTTGVDLSGTSVVTGTPLPGVGYNCGGVDCSKSQVASAVAAFNSTFAGTKAPNGSVIPKFVLPSDYQFGDPTFSQDFRLSRRFVYKERYTFTLLGEVFNAFNIANLKGYSFNLDTANANPAAQTFAFGQPTQRALQTFGSGGPRAFQLGGRLSF
jgi:Carboxypeptidase regulatory-like domain